MKTKGIEICMDESQGRIFLHAPFYIIAGVKSQKNLEIWAEMARRKKQFHPNTPWRDIKLWGLFGWGYVSTLLKRGELLAPGYTKENKTVWCYPTEAAYKKHIEPLLSFDIEILTKLAGW
jgi:hypothetical protein